MQIINGVPAEISKFPYQVQYSFISRYRRYRSISYIYIRYWFRLETSGWTFDSLFNSGYHYILQRSINFSLDSHDGRPLPRKVRILVYLTKIYLQSKLKQVNFIIQTSRMPANSATDIKVTLNSTMAFEDPVGSISRSATGILIHPNYTGQTQTKRSVT